MIAKQADGARNDSQTIIKRLREISPDTRRRFDDLATRWKSECLFTSSTTDIAMHPSYQRIIGMGPVAVPLILHDLSDAPHHWFWALTAITDATPVPTTDAGQIQKMTDHWLRWAAANGYEWKE